MKEKTIKLYEFKELAPEIQKIVIDQFKSEEEFYFLKDDLTDYITEKITNLGYTIHNLKLYYSLTNCQGDGVMFEATLEKDNVSYIITQSGHYYHYNSKIINIYNEEGDTIEDNGFNDLYISWCRDLEKYGYAIIEDTLRDEVIIENIEANEYYFRANGEIEQI
jgi:hypothetical protein